MIGRLTDSPTGFGGLSYTPGAPFGGDQTSRSRKSTHTYGNAQNRLEHFTEGQRSTGFT
jgi:hypothetical protein